MFCWTIPGKPSDWLNDDSTLLSDIDASGNQTEGEFRRKDGAVGLILHDDLKKFGKAADSDGDDEELNEASYIEWNPSDFQYTFFLLYFRSDRSIKRAILQEVFSSIF